MKISNNALNFLLAQYRAIFKRAYVKGIASAVLLTAGLAAGQAQAAVATLDGTTLTLPTSGQTAVIDGDSGTTAGQYNKGEAHFTNVAIYGGDLKWDGVLVIESGKALQVDNRENNRILGGSTNVNISGNGSLTIDINRNGKASTDGLKIAGNSKDVTVDIGTINVQNGLLAITDKAETNSGTTTVSADTITIGSENNSSSQGFITLMSEGSSKNATLGRSGSTVTGSEATASKITVYGNGMLTVGTKGGAGTRIYGAELNLLGGANMITNAGADTENLEQVDHLVVDAKSFKVIDGNGSGATFSGTTAEIDGNVLIGSGASWVLATKDKVVDKQTIKANVAFESGSNVQIGGKLTVSGGKLTVDENAGLFATQATGSTIEVKNNGTDSGTLVIGVESLQKFLNGDQEYTAIVKNDQTNKYELKEYGQSDTKPKSVSGSVLVTNGILQLVSDKQINLADTKQFAFSGGTTADEGKIVISGSKIVADNVLVSKQITDVDFSDGVALEVNDLTLGDATVATPVTDYGFSSATAHNLTVLASGGNFTLQNNVTLRATSRDVMLDSDEIEVAEYGIITGNLNVANCSLTVEAGRYTTNDNLTLTAGILNIHGTSGDSAVAEGVTYYPNALDASLTVKGNFELAGASNSTINITGQSGADAYLELRQADSVKWGSGTFTISGALAANSADLNAEQVGQGTLYITGAQFEQYLDTETGTGHAASTSKIDLKNNGVLFVDGSTTSLEYNVSDFGTSPNSGSVAFTGAGTFETDTALTISITDDDSNKYLAIGAGTIKAPSIDLQYNAEDKSADTQFVISGGTLEVASRLTSNVGMVSFENNSTSGGILNLDGQGSVGVDVTFNGAYSALKVQSGRWTAQNAFFEANSALKIDDGASLELDNINVTGASVTGTLATGSSLTVDTIQTDQATTPTFTIADKAIMTINGRNDIVETGDNADIDAVVDNADTAGINLAGATFNVNGAEAQLKIGSAAISKLVSFENKSVNNEQVKVLTVDDALKATYKLTGFSTLYLDFADSVTLTADNAKELKEALFNNGVVGDGIINVGSGSLAIEWTDEKALIADWDAVKDFAEIESVTSEELQQALITNVTGKVAGHYGAMQVDADKALSVDGNLGLHAARDGYFVFSQSGEAKTAEDVVIHGGSLLLGGAGKIGAINAGGNDVTIAPSTLEGAVAGTTEVLGAITNAGTLDISNETTVAGDVSANTLDLADDTSLTNSTYSMTLGSAQVGANASLGTTNLTLNDVAGESWIEGRVDVASKLTVSAGDVTIANGTVSAQATELASGVTFQVGQDAVADQDDPATPDLNEAESFSGTFETTTLALNGATFIVDPEYGLPTALASVRNFADASDAQYTDESKVGTADGSIFVGQNSALGIGTENAAELAQVIAKYQTNGSLSNAEDRLGAIVCLDGIATIGDTQSLVMTNKSVEDFITYYNGANGTQTDFADQATDPTSVFTNTIYFGDGTALMANAAAIKDAYDQGTALVTFAGQNGKLVADGGEILITGDLRGNTKYTLFADKGGIGDANGTLVNVYDVTGTAVEEGKGIAVTTENGFLVGEINNENGGVVTLGLAGDARARMSGASDPVYDTLVAYFNGYNNITKDPDTGAEVKDELYKTIVPHEDPATGEITYTKDTNYSNNFLAGALAQGNGSAAEAAARMGVYGGAPQAAIKAGQSSTDAIAARFGIGSAISNLTVAGNTQGAALWLAPVYKTSDSDGFDAQGVDYGVNVDLYGVALGADYTLANGMSFGAMFNVGSGEVDGEGAASSTSNDFDYYGFGAYVGYTMGQFSVVGDVSYTVADNEVEASTSVDHIGAQMDSTNLSLGVTGKYELSFNGVNVTPHVGLRYSNIDLDDYTIDGNDVIASADSDKLNLFSIPVGVTIAKEFKGESWTVAPSFDLTLTGQFGDDELDGSVSWAGVSNLTTDTTTEVFDNFTYGATLGVEAQSVGGVALGINVGYTGSSNVDEFGVNANARFVF